MKKPRGKNLLYLAGSVVFIGITTAFMGFYPGGSPGGYSGSPLDGKNCVNCHKGTAVNQTGIISSDIDTGGYVPGNTYKITVTIGGSGLKGFEVSPLDALNKPAGKLAAGSDTRLVNSSRAVTQSVTNGANPSTWSFNWTAPVAGTGNITFYGAFISGKLNTKLSSLTVSEKKTTSISDNNISGPKIWYDYSSRHIYVEDVQAANNEISLSIYKTDGRLIQQMLQILPQQGRYTIPTHLSESELPGLYIIRVILNKRQYTRSLFFY